MAFFFVDFLTGVFLCFVGWFLLLWLDCFNLLVWVFYAFFILLAEVFWEKWSYQNCFPPIFKVDKYSYSGKIRILIWISDHLDIPGELMRNYGIDVFSSAKEDWKISCVDIPTSTTTTNYFHKNISVLKTLVFWEYTENYITAMIS